MQPRRRRRCRLARAGARGPAVPAASSSAARSEPLEGAGRLGAQHEAAGADVAIGQRLHLEVLRPGEARGLHPAECPQLAHEGASLAMEQPTARPRRSGRPSASGAADQQPPSPMPIAATATAAGGGAEPVGGRRDRRDPGVQPSGVARRAAAVAGAGQVDAQRRMPGVGELLRPGRGGCGRSRCPPTRTGGRCRTAVSRCSPLGRRVQQAEHGLDAAHVEIDPAAGGGEELTPWSLEADPRCPMAVGGRSARAPLGSPP